MTTPDDGFYHKRAPETPAEAVTETPRGKDIGVTKAVLQRYIQRWLTPDSAHRRLLESYSPRSANFVLNRPAARNVHVDTSFSWETDDATERKVQVARFMTKLKERYPAVLIVDGGFRNRPAGLGDIQGGRVVGGTVVDYDLVTSLVISVEIIVAALDESTCSDLALLVSSIFGSPLRRFGGGNHLTDSDQGTSYQIVVNNLEVSFGALSRENINEDPVDSKWSCTASLEIGYEAIGSIRAQLPIRQGDTRLTDEGGAQGADENYGARNAAGNLEINGPTSVRMGQRVEYNILDPNNRPAIIPGQYKMQVTDRRLAGFKRLGNHGVMLTAKRPGTIELRMVDPNLSETDESTGHTHPKVVARLEITITA